MRKKSRSAALLLAAVMLVVGSAGATGCTKKGTDANGGAPESKVVKIGVGVPLTQGVVAFGEGAVRATKLAAKQANESDRAKELGITFEVVEGDDQGDPKVGVNAANQFASDQALVGVVGHINSGVNIPASKVYNEARIVNVTPAATNPALTQQGFDNVFRTTTIDTVQGSFAADAASQELGLKKAFVIDDSTPYGEGLADYFAQKFASNGGEVLGREKTSDKDSDFSALVTRIKAAEPDVIYYGGVYNAGAVLVKQLRTAGVSASVFGGDGFNDVQFIELAGDAAEGTFSTAIGLPLDELPDGQAFKAAFAAEYPGEEIAATDPYSYDAANVIIEGVLAAAGEVGADAITTPAGREAIIKAVAATKLEGLTGSIAFDENGDTINTAVTLNVVKGKEWTPYKK